MSEDNFIGRVARVEGAWGENENPVTGTGAIVGCGFSVANDPTVCVRGVGYVPLAWVREVDNEPADIAALSAWWRRELSTMAAAFKPRGVR